MGVGDERDPLLARQVLPGTDRRGDRPHRAASIAATPTLGTPEAPSCTVPMGHASSRPGRAARGTRFSGCPCDMTETGQRHDSSGANQSLREWQIRHGLSAGRLAAFMSWGLPPHIRTSPTPSPKLPNVGDARPQVWRLSFRPASEPPGAVSSRAASRPRGEYAR